MGCAFGVCSSPMQQMYNAMLPVLVLLYRFLSFICRPSLRVLQVGLNLPMYLSSAICVRVLVASHL